MGGLARGRDRAYHEVLVLDLSIHALAKENADCFARLISMGGRNAIPYVSGAISF